VTALFALLPCTTAAAAAEPVDLALKPSPAIRDVGSRRQLFTDRRFVEAGEGVTLVVNPPVEHTPVLPGEGLETEHINGYSTIIQERADGPLRLYANVLDDYAPVIRDWLEGRVDHWPERSRGETPAMRDVTLRLYESADGLHFTRPRLGVVEHHGSFDNNVVLTGRIEATPFVDANPRCPSEERWKMITSENTPVMVEGFSQAPQQGLALWVSPDGIRWTALPEPLVVEHSDTQIVACYDQRLQRYVIYTRHWMVGPQSPQVPTGLSSHWIAPGRRSIGRTESAGFRRFPLSELILVPPLDMPPSDVLYTNCKTTIPGNPDLHVMFPTIWHQGDDTTSVAMAASHDGKVWDFVPGGPVFDTAAFGEWDGGCVFASPNLVELPDGSFALPYTGYNFPHKYPRGQLRFLPGYLVWPKGRLVGLEATERGEFATVAVMPPGNKLLVNAVVKRAGSLLVEVAGLDGAPLPGRSFAEADPVAGDQHRKPLTWKGQDSLGHKPGTPIILRMRMDKATLFGLEFAD